MRWRFLSSGQRFPLRGARGGDRDAMCGSPRSRYSGDYGAGGPSSNGVGVDGGLHSASPFLVGVMKKAPRVSIPGGPLIFYFFS
jgi:hypothetical protein